MGLQQYEDQAAVRLKFASMDGPRLVDDVIDEYEGFLDDLPEGWKVVEEGDIETIAEALRSAKRLARGDLELVVVEHETGVELLLIAEGIKVAGTIVSAGVVALAGHLWGEWRRRRARTLPERQNERWVAGADALIVETNHYQPDGTVTQKRVIVGPSAISDERFEREIAEALHAITS